MKSHIGKGFETGQVVPQSGSYTVSHKPHLLTREATLLKEHIFPACAKCMVPVHFDLLHAVQTESAQDKFRLLMHTHN
ncbi:MAG TPA: hypothetical protein VNZ47_01985 [Candidatus Dormibacteraeota bacterium]|jgi:hypothetical protein|nr:hypothetical protein [Candidatus Dormibacteraeota bacterium]